MSMAPDTDGENQYMRANTTTTDGTSSLDSNAEATLLSPGLLDSPRHTLSLPMQTSAILLFICHMGIIYILK
jgi:hypothetical protein